MRRFIVPVALSAGALLLSGCMTGPDYTRPELSVPDQWSEALEGGERAGDPSPEQWWTTLGDAQLDSLIARAFEGSFDLRVAAARLDEARAYEDITGASLWPQVNAGADYKRSQSRGIDASSSGTAGSLTLTPGGLGVSVSGTPAGATGPRVSLSPDLSGGGNSSMTVSSGAGPAPDRQSDFFQTGFDASWELDVFGGIRRGQEAARADTEGVEEMQRDVLISVAAEVARNYFALRSAQNRLDTATKNIEVQSQGLALARSRFDAGLTSSLDVTIAEAELASSQSVLPSLETAVQMSIHRLGVLTGSAPGSLQQELQAHAPLSPRPAEVPVGLPTDIVRRRPDVREAERAVAAATARIGVAQADLYPRFALAGSLTGSSTAFEGITRGANQLWSFGPSIRWPIFDGGRIRANIRVQDARLEQTLAAYEYTVMIALEEVENALVAYAKEQNRLISLEEAVRANRHAVDIAKSLYANGLTSFLNVLDSERSLFVAEDQQIQSEAIVLTNLVALYKALGGGWADTYPEREDQRTADALQGDAPPA